MTNGQHIARSRHLEELANAAKRYTLREILDVTNAVATELETLGGESYADFTGATSIAGGLSGLVPAPAAGDEEKFLRGDGTWSTVASGGSSSTEIILPTVPATVNGGFWLDVSGETLVPKFFYGGTVYTLSGNAELTLPEGLISWLKFDTDATTDECGLTWEATGNPTIGNSNAIKGKALQLDGSSYLKSGAFLLGGKDFTVSFWTYYSTLKSEGVVNFCRNDYYSQPYSFYVFVNQKNYYQTSYTDINGDDKYIDDNTVYVRDKLSHCAIVYRHDAETLKFYADGTLIRTCIMAIPRDSYNAYVGVCQENPNKWGFDGTIDEFQIYDGVALWTENFTPPTASDYE